MQNNMLFAGAVLELPPSGLGMLDGIQRCGRMLLGFCRRSPAPAILSELGWMPTTGSNRNQNTATKLNVFLLFLGFVIMCYCSLGVLIIPKLLINDC